MRSSERLLDLLDEQPLAADLRERHVEDLVALRLDHVELDGDARAATAASRALTCSACHSASALPRVAITSRSMPVVLTAAAFLSGDSATASGSAGADSRAFASGRQPEQLAQDLRAQRRLVGRCLAERGGRLVEQLVDDELDERAGSPRAAAPACARVRASCVERLLHLGVGDLREPLAQRADRRHHALRAQPVLELAGLVLDDLRRRARRPSRARRGSRRRPARDRRCRTGRRRRGRRSPARRRAARRCRSPPSAATAAPS